MRVELLAVGGDDAGGLLPAVLQRVKAEVGDVGGLGVPVDREHPALIVEAVVVVELGRAIPRPSRRVEHDEVSAARHRGVQT